MDLICGLLQVLHVTPEHHGGRERRMGEEGGGRKVKGEGGGRHSVRSLCDLVARVACLYP